MRQVLGLCAVFAMSFCAGLLIFGAFYYKFGISIEQLLFILHFPLTGLDNAVIMFLFKDTFIFVIMPSLLLAIFISFLPKILQIRALKNFIQKITQSLKSHALSAQITFSVCFLIVGIHLADKKLEIFTMIDNYFFKDYSSFYEEHYITPNVKNAKNTRNLIIIFAESLESTFSAKNVPKGASQSAYSPRGELIPNLTQLAIDNINFSASNVPKGAIGGHLPNSGAAYTMAAIFSYMCGVPIKRIRGGVDSRKFNFSAPCLSRILHDFGYTQATFSGADAVFAGHNYFFANQNIEVFDAKSLRELGYLPKDYRKNWGVEDSKIFHFAKQYLREYEGNRPFALYVATVDTHFPDGYVDSSVCADLEQGYANAVKCSDRMIGDFVEFVKTSRFGNNTTIVIFGDHPTMERDFIDEGANRFVFNAFINPHFSANPTHKLTKNRALTHFDFTPLILDSLGFRVEAFGLGRNPLLGETLIEKLGIIAVEKGISRPSRKLEGFWQH